VALAVDVPARAGLDAVALAQGIGRPLATLLIGAALLAAGCTGDGRPTATSAQPSSPPATRSAAYGITCLKGAERLRRFAFASVRG
jgi:hypothetical protein